MRIAQLDLKAFGHFTGRRLSFEAAPDFHIAYGPNEAGKTTISRALRAALFGIPERTGDNHLHANPSLRVGIVLSSAAGEQMAVMRRKARKNSLVRYDPTTGEELPEAIPEDTLATWMGGLTEGLYTSMFGLDHDELVAGGRALSEGKGELGQSLFEAGAGLSSVRALRERLAKEADELFRPRASTSAIYRVLEQYNEARREAKEAQTRPAEWEVLRKAADEARAAYEGARQQQDILQREARRMERLAAVLPDVAARALALDGPFEFQAELARQIRGHDVLAAGIAEEAERPFPVQDHVEVDVIVQELEGHGRRALPARDGEVRGWRLRHAEHRFVQGDVELDALDRHDLVVAGLAVGRARDEREFQA